MPPIRNDLKPFIVDADNFQLLQGDVPVGSIMELRPEDAGLLARHLGNNPHTVYLASSGVPVHQNDYGMFKNCQTLVAIEWVREEANPRPNEPSCNLNRYIFGIANDGKCYGKDVTESLANNQTQQVGNHWADLDAMCRGHFDIEFI